MAAPVPPAAQPVKRIVTSRQIDRLMGYHALMVVPQRASRARRGADGPPPRTPRMSETGLSALRRKPRRIDVSDLDVDDTGAAPTRVDLIRAAARRHFAEHGYDAASMRDIAADAGITIATLYFHCATKEQLLLDVLDRAMDRLSAAVNGAEAAAGPSWSDRLAAA